MGNECCKPRVKDIVPSHLCGYQMCQFVEDQFYGESILLTFKNGFKLIVKQFEYSDEEYHKQLNYYQNRQQ